MTDLEKFKELYDSIGVEYYFDLKESFAPGPSVLKRTSHLMFIYEDHDDPKLAGYPGFYTRIEFSKKGKFIKQGFWE